MRALLLTSALAALASPLRAQEPAPRPLAPIAIPLSANLASISGVHELSGGKLLVSDPKGGSLHLLDPAAHTMTPVGSAGGDELQYAQPGGFYAGRADTALLLDHGLSKALVIAPNGSIVGMRSLKRKGITSSNDDEVDHQQVDARGLAYFTFHGRLKPARRGESLNDSIPLIRFDATRQRYDTVTFLREPEARVVEATENMQQTQVVAGSPADAWGVASDGRVAVVRAVPYHVEWIGADGRVQRGPTYVAAPIAFAQSEKDSIIARSARGGGASVSGMGQQSASSAKSTFYFADAKAPFAGETSARVSPRGQVWVARSQPFRATSTVYDVFDERGERVDRVSFPGNVRVAGFGDGVVYTVGRDSAGKLALAKYKLQSRSSR